MEKLILEQLIEAGECADGDFSSAIRIIEGSKLTWSMLHQGGAESWDEISKQLPLKDLVSLARALTIIDTIPGFSSGSVAPVIWIFHELERRDYQELLLLAEWIIERDKENSYAPFGTSARHLEKLNSLRDRDSLSRLKAKSAGSEQENELRFHRHDFTDPAILRSCDYDDETKEMHITFASGETHKFSGVGREVYEGLKAANTLGSYFHLNIRRKFRSRKVDCKPSDMRNQRRSSDV